MRKRTISFVFAIVAVLGLSTAAFAGHSTVSDVEDTDTHAEGIHWVIGEGIGVGFPNGEYGSGENITRGQFATMLHNYDEEHEHDGGGDGDGPRGPRGSSGSDGEDGVSGYETLNSEQRLEKGRNVVTTPCPGDKVALGGGYELSVEEDADVIASEPVLGSRDSVHVGTGWEVTADAGKDKTNLKVWVTCANVS